MQFLIHLIDSPPSEAAAMKPPPSGGEAVRHENQSQKIIAARIDYVVIFRTSYLSRQRA
jgi:hypothetical protein